MGKLLNGFWLRNGELFKTISTCVFVVKSGILLKKINDENHFTERSLKQQL